MRNILSLIIAMLFMLSVAFMLWRHRTRNLAHVSAKLDSYWDTIKERRKFTRFKKQLSVECSVAGKANDVYHAFSQNISGEGICLEVPEIMPEKSQVDLYIKLPDKKSVTVSGEVSWVSEIKRDSSSLERVFQIGVKFLKIDTRDKDLLNKFIDQVSMHDA